MNFGPQSGANWLISQKLQRVESEAASQIARVNHAKTIDEVIRAADVPVPAEIRFMRNSIRGLRSLESAAERRIEELLNGRLQQIANAESAAEAKAKRGRFIQDCSMLRGKFSRQYGYADRESKRLVYLKEQAESSAKAERVDPSND